MELLILLTMMLAAALILILPLKLAAIAVKAGRTGAGWCFLALLAAFVTQAIGMSFSSWGSLIAFLLSAAVFAGVLQTTFVRGIAIAVLHVVFGLLLLFAIGMLGLSLPSWRSPL
ncbi:MAG: hypothetical protein O3B24_08480 [Verrucomicrobia bacterium]|nr:hypothetical protein [Verrucomicrobiota bacterium]